MQIWDFQTTFIVHCNLIPKLVFTLNNFSLLSILYDDGHCVSSQTKPIQQHLNFISSPQTTTTMNDFRVHGRSKRRSKREELTTWTEELQGFFFCWKVMQRNQRKRSTFWKNIQENDISKENEGDHRTSNYRDKNSRTIMIIQEWEISWWEQEEETQSLLSLQFKWVIAWCDFYSVKRLEIIDEKRILSLAGN